MRSGGGDTKTYYVEYRVKKNDDKPIPRSAVIVHEKPFSFAAQWSFDPRTPIVTEVDGTGRIVSSPVGIDCLAKCDMLDRPGDVINLHATPGPNQAFIVVPPTSSPRRASGPACRASSTRSS